jgi:stage II sporulation protein M
MGIPIIDIPKIKTSAIYRIFDVILFLKGFMIGFSIATIIAKYKFIGIIGSLSYIFPHVIISMLIIFAISYYALKLSFSILKAVIEKKTINFSEVINRYSLIMIISIIIMVISSLIETFISPYIIKLFLMLT